MSAATWRVIEEVTMTSNAVQPACINDANGHHDFDSPGVVGECGNCAAPDPQAEPAKATEARQPVDHSPQACPRCGASSGAGLVICMTCHGSGVVSTADASEFHCLHAKSSPVERTRCGVIGGEQLCAADDPSMCATHHDVPDWWPHDKRPPRA